MRFQGFKAFGMLGDVGRVKQLFADDHIQHGVKQGHVGTRRKTHAQVGIGIQRLTTGVEYHDFGATLGGLLEKGGGHRMVHRRVAAGKYYYVGLAGLHKGSGYRA